MRIRQVKPAFWTDKMMAGLSKSARLTYIGLWGLADDAGWFRLEIDQAAAELFPFESTKRRERDLARDIEALTEAGRIVRYLCGHVEIPHLTEHQHLPTLDKRVHTEWRKHQKTCLSPYLSAGPREEPRETAGPRDGKERERVREGKGSDGSATTEFREKVGPL